MISPLSRDLILEEIETSNSIRKQSPVVLMGNVCIADLDPALATAGTAATQPSGPAAASSENYA